MSDDAYHQAVTMLARREHGALELGRKLSKKGHSEAVIQSVLEKCQQLGLQHDARFAAQKIRTRVAQGYGPLRVQLELQHLGVSRDVIEAAFFAEAYDWHEQAAFVLQKKYGNISSRTPAILQKQKQFLLYRGFSMTTIMQVMRNHD